MALKNIEYVRRLEGQTAAIVQQRDAIQQQKAEIEELQKRVVAENTTQRAGSTDGLYHRLATVRAHVTPLRDQLADM